MGMTMTQKILAKHAGMNEVKKGQLIEANLDLVLGNDITTPVAITEFNKLGIDKLNLRQKDLSDFEVEILSKKDEVIDVRNYYR